jgi:hypothetical protein
MGLVQPWVPAAGVVSPLLAADGQETASAPGLRSCRAGPGAPSPTALPTTEMPVASPKGPREKKKRPGLLAGRSLSGLAHEHRVRRTTPPSMPIVPSEPDGQKNEGGQLGWGADPCRLARQGSRRGRRAPGWPANDFTGRACRPGSRRGSGWAPAWTLAHRRPQAYPGLYRNPLIQAGTVGREGGGLTGGVRHEDPGAA